MPKNLTRSQPTSSISRFLEPGVVKAALSEPDRANVGNPSTPKADGESPAIKRELILTPSADDILSQLVRVLSRATRTNITNSHFLRALLKALAQALPEIEHQASLLGILKRPSNARGNESNREEYERRLAAALLAGMRASRPAESARFLANQ